MPRAPRKRPGSAALAVKEAADMATVSVGASAPASAPPPLTRWPSPSRAAEVGDMLRRAASGPPPRAGPAGREMDLRPQQRVAADFFRGESPYRGLLLYHGVGSGKSCAAVVAAEAARETTGRPLFVVLKASLRGNFETEIEKCASWAPGTEVNFVHMNGIDASKVSAATSTVDGRSLHGAVVVVDEVHNLIREAISRGLGARTRGALLFQAIYRARDVKIVALSATPAVKNPFEVAALLCLIHGPVTTLRLRGAPAGPGPLRALLAHPRVAEAEREPGGDLVVAPVHGFRHRRAGAPPGAELELAPEAESERYRPRAGKAQYDALADELAAATGATAHREAESDLFPLDAASFNAEHVDFSTSGARRPDALRMRAAGKVSWFRLSEADMRELGFPRVLEPVTHELPMTPDQFDRYKEVRLQEMRMEQSLARDNRAAKETAGEEADRAGIFRQLSRSVCNFAFRNRGERPFPSDVLRAMREGEALGRDGRRDRDADRLYEEALRGAIARLREGGAAALREPQLSAVHSPKMGRVLAALTEAGAKMPAIVYSAYRNMEGVELMSEVLAANGFSKVRLEADGSVGAATPKKGPYYMIFGEDDVGAAVRLFNGAPTPETKGWLAGRARGRPAGAAPVEVLLITSAAAEGINLKGVRQVHIMEPHWNEARLLQVIGRASRTGSHSHLAPEERDVSVHRYVATVTPAQRRDRLIEKDGGLTSDQTVLRSAEHGSRLLRGFIEALQQAAVDCGLHDPADACFRPPPGGTLSELAIAREASERLVESSSAHKRASATKQVRARVIAVDSTRVALVAADTGARQPGLYDRASYEEGGQLVPVQGGGGGGGKN